MESAGCGANNCPLAPLWTRAEMLSLITLLINVLLGVAFGCWISLTNLGISKTNLRISQANAKPLLRFVAVNTGSKVELRIVNHGKGPAIITRLQVTGRTPTDKAQHAQYVVTSQTARRPVPDALKPARVNIETVVKNQVVKADDKEGLVLLVMELTNYDTRDEACRSQWLDFLEPVRHELGHSHSQRFSSHACFEIEFQDLLGNTESWKDTGNVFDPSRKHRGGNCSFCDAELAKRIVGPGEPRRSEWQLLEPQTSYLTSSSSRSLTWTKCGPISDQEPPGGTYRGSRPLVSHVPWSRTSLHV